MTAAPTSQRSDFTPEDLELLSDGVDFELIDGELVERNLSSYTSSIAARLIRRLGDHIEPRGLGELGGSDFGLQIFTWNPNRVVKPDGCFISAAKLPNGLPRRGWLRVAPDLVFEVVSPGDRAGDVEAKVRDYLAAGVSLVWVVYPDTRSVTVHHPDGTAVSLAATAELTGGDVLPGFRARVSDLFPPVDAEPPPAPKRRRKS